MKSQNLQEKYFNNIQCQCNCFLLVHYAVMYLQIVIWVESHNSRAFSLISFAFLLSGYGSVVCHRSCKPCGNYNSLYPVLYHGNVQWTKHHIHILAWFHRYPERTAVLSYVQLSKNLCHGCRLVERDWMVQSLSRGIETDWPKNIIEW